MNRLLLVPGIVSCLGFALLVSSASSEGSSESDGATASVPGKTKAKVLLDVAQIEQQLVERWRHYTRSKRAFSRVLRAEKAPRIPGVLVNESLPTPDGSFAGIFTLQSADSDLQSALNERNDAQGVKITKAEFPIVVDRRTGQTIIFAAGQWSEFNRWAVKE